MRLTAAATLPADHAKGAYQWSRLVPDTWASIMKLPRSLAIPKFMHDRDRMERALVQLTRFGLQGPLCFLHGDYHLGNLYFDAERYDDAIKWYEEGFQLNPKDPNLSTDLGVSYYYTNQPDKALEQFKQSLAVDPKHLKTMLNMGIVMAFGKQDLETGVFDEPDHC